MARKIHRLCWLFVLLLLAFATFVPVALEAGAQKAASEIMAGKAIYEQHCAKCHGIAGWGDGPMAESLRVAPRNFHDVITDLKPDEHLRMSVAYGVMTTPMHAWRGTLSDQEITDVVSYIRLLSNRVR
ncbi:cytochrome c [Nitrospira sp.]|nr:cytochrome c [Nitrospira sp.]